MANVDHHHHDGAVRQRAPLYDMDENDDEPRDDNNGEHNGGGGAAAFESGSSTPLTLYRDDDDLQSRSSEENESYFFDGGGDDDDVMRSSSAGRRDDGDEDGDGGGGGGVGGGSPFRDGFHDGFRDDDEEEERVERGRGRAARVRDHDDDDDDEEKISTDESDSAAEEEEFAVILARGPLPLSPTTGSSSSSSPVDSPQERRRGDRSSTAPPPHRVNTVHNSGDSGDSDDANDNDDEDEILSYLLHLSTASPATLLRLSRLSALLTHSQRRAASTIQRRYRSIVQRKSSAVFIQRWYRRAVQRRCRAANLIAQSWTRYKLLRERRRDDAATVMARGWRKSKERRTRENAAGVVGAWWRHEVQRLWHRRLCLMRAIDASLNLSVKGNDDDDGDNDTNADEKRDGGIGGEARPAAEKVTNGGGRKATFANGIEGPSSAATQDDGGRRSSSGFENGVAGGKDGDGDGGGSVLGRLFGVGVGASGAAMTKLPPVPPSAAETTATTATAAAAAAEKTRRVVPIATNDDVLDRLYQLASTLGIIVPASTTPNPASNNNDDVESDEDDEMDLLSSSSPPRIASETAWALFELLRCCSPSRSSSPFSATACDDNVRAVASSLLRRHVLSTVSLQYDAFSPYVTTLGLTPRQIRHLKHQCINDLRSRDWTTFRCAVRLLAALAYLPLDDDDGGGGGGGAKDEEGENNNKEEEVMGLLLQRLEGRIGREGYPGRLFVRKPSPFQRTMVQRQQQQQRRLRNVSRSNANISKSKSKRRSSDDSASVATASSNNSSRRRKRKKKDDSVNRQGDAADNGGATTEYWLLKWGGASCAFDLLRLLHRLARTNASWDVLFRRGYLRVILRLWADASSPIQPVSSSSSSSSGGDGGGGSGGGGGILEEEMMGGGALYAAVHASDPRVAFVAGNAWDQWPTEDESFRYALSYAVQDLVGGWTTTSASAAAAVGEEEEHGQQGESGGRSSIDAKNALDRATYGELTALFVLRGALMLSRPLALGGGVGDNDNDDGDNNNNNNGEEEFRVADLLERTGPWVAAAGGSGRSGGGGRRGGTRPRNERRSKAWYGYHVSDHDAATACRFVARLLVNILCAAHRNPPYYREFINQCRSDLDVRCFRHHGHRTFRGVFASQPALLPVVDHGTIGESLLSDSPEARLVALYVLRGLSREQMLEHVTGESYASALLRHPDAIAGSWFDRPPDAGALGPDLVDTLAQCAAASDRIDCLRRYGGDMALLFDADGSTLLHVAAAYGASEVASYLLSRGLRADVRNGRGDTPVGIALRNKHRRCATVLEYGLGGDVDEVPECDSSSVSTVAAESRASGRSSHDDGGDQDGTSVVTHPVVRLDEVSFLAVLDAHRRIPDHPSVVRIKAADVMDGGAAEMRLEPVAGTLKELMESWNDGSSSSLSSRLALCHQLLLGIEAAHGAGVLHTGIGPEHIYYVLIDDAADGEGGSAALKLGVVGHRAATIPNFRESVFSMWVGGVARDVFATGCVLSMIVSGHDLVNLQTGGQFRKMKRQLRRVSVEAYDLVERMVLHQPSVNECVFHPVFWDAKERFDYIRALVGNRRHLDLPSGETLDLNVDWRTKILRGGVLSHHMKSMKLRYSRLPSDLLVMLNDFCQQLSGEHESEDLTDAAEELNVSFPELFLTLTCIFGYRTPPNH